MIGVLELPDSYNHIPEPKCSVLYDGESPLAVDLTVNGNTTMRLSFEYIASLFVKYCINQFNGKSVHYIFSVLLFRFDYS